MVSPFHTKDRKLGCQLTEPALLWGGGDWGALGGCGVFDCALALCVCLVGPSWPSLGQPWPTGGAGVQAQREI